MDACLRLWLRSIENAYCFGCVIAGCVYECFGETGRLCCALMKFIKRSSSSENIILCAIVADQQHDCVCMWVWLVSVYCWRLVCAAESWWESSVESKSLIKRSGNYYEPLLLRVIHLSSVQSWPSSQLNYKIFTNLARIYCLLCPVAYRGKIIIYSNKKRWTKWNSSNEGGLVRCVWWSFLEARLNIEEFKWSVVYPPEQFVQWWWWITSPNRRYRLKIASTNQNNWNNSSIQMWITIIVTWTGKTSAGEQPS